MVGPALDWRRVFLAAPTSLVVLEAGTGGRILEANAAFSAWVQATGELAGRRVTELGLEVGVADFERLRQEVASTQTLRDARIRARRAGEELDLFVSLARVDIAGRACHVVSVVDASPRARAEDELRRTQERYQAMVEHVQDYAIFLLDPSGHVQTWNPGAERIKGYRASEILGHSFEEFYPPEDRASGLPQRLLAQARERGVVEHEGWRVRKDGTRFWANVVITALRNSKGELEGFIKITRDLTERRQREEADRLAYQRLLEVRSLEEVNHLKGTFLNLCAHELITPMTPLNVMVHSIARRVQDPELQRKLAIVQRNLDRLHRLLGDVLDASRLDARKLNLRRQDVEVAQLVRHAVELREAQAEQKGVKLACTVAPEAAVVDGDEDRLTQVVDNLLSNALKFTPPGGSIQLHLAREDGLVRLSVSDTGPGMEPEFLRRVFEPFSRSQQHETQVEPGTGLGLYISKGIVELHGGGIRAESGGRGQGTRMVVELPLNPARHAPAAPAPLA
ncbi:MAG: PAS domain-containing sensor histidine kinase [Halobacteriales archaeon]|nr:PAS domain-containing sensor histidine kinase [Halobacteriales archaeon]